MENSNIKNKKVSIIGLGSVGAGIANALTLKNIANEIALIDINKNLANAEMLDIRHGLSEMGNTKIVCGDYSDIENSDLVIVTAGRGRKPNESRLDLIQDNLKIAESIAINIKKNYKQGVVLVVSNPVDVITYYFTKLLNLPKGKVFGTGCILDASRFVNVISDFLNKPVADIDATVIGEHGQSLIPLWSNVKVDKLPIEQYCNKENLSFGENEKSIIEQKTKKMGMEIILGKGKTCYGISACVSYIADAILNDKTITASVASSLDGEFGLNDVALSLPSIITSEGVVQILPIDLDGSELENLKNSALVVSDVIKEIKGNFVNV